MNKLTRDYLKKTGIRLKAFKIVKDALSDVIGEEQEIRQYIAEEVLQVINNAKFVVGIITRAFKAC